MDALPLMKSIIAARPSSFRSVSDAIQWQYVSCPLGNLSLTKWGIV